MTSFIETARGLGGASGINDCSSFIGGLLLISVPFLGPAIGSLFYMWGGFVLPFYIVGSIILSLSALSILLIPKQHYEEKVDAHTTFKKNSLTTWKFLKVVKLAVLCLFRFNAF